MASITVMKPDAPISAAHPMAPIEAPEQSPIADSSRLTGMCTNRSSRSTASMTPVNQLAGSDATSRTPHAASSSAMRLLVSDGLSFMARLPFPHSPHAARVAQRAPDRFRPNRQGDIAYAKMPQRIDDRIADCGGRADRSAFSSPPPAAGIAGRGAPQEGGGESADIAPPGPPPIEQTHTQEQPPRPRL